MMNAVGRCVEEEEPLHGHRRFPRRELEEVAATPFHGSRLVSINHPFS